MPEFTATHKGRLGDIGIGSSCLWVEIFYFTNLPVWKRPPDWGLSALREWHTNCHTLEAATSTRDGTALITFIESDDV